MKCEEETEEATVSQAYFALHETSHTFQIF